MLAKNEFGVPATGSCLVYTVSTLRWPVNQAKRLSLMFIQDGVRTASCPFFHLLLSWVSCERRAPSLGQSVSDSCMRTTRLSDVGCRAAWIRFWSGHRYWLNMSRHTPDCLHSGTWGPVSPCLEVQWEDQFSGDTQSGLKPQNFISNLVWWSCPCFCLRINSL